MSAFGVGSQSGCRGSRAVIAVARCRRRRRSVRMVSPRQSATDRRVNRKSLWRIEPTSPQRRAAHVLRWDYLSCAVVEGARRWWHHTAIYENTQNRRRSVCLSTNGRTDKRRVTGMRERESERGLVQRERKSASQRTSRSRLSFHSRPMHCLGAQCLRGSMYDDYDDARGLSVAPGAKIYKSNVGLITDCTIVQRRMATRLYLKHESMLCSAVLYTRRQRRPFVYLQLAVLCSSVTHSWTWALTFCIVWFTWCAARRTI